MPFLRKVTSLTLLERRAATRSMLYVPAIRLGLTILPFRWIRRWVDKLELGDQPAAAETEVMDAAVWSVIAVSLRVPKATCLTQALALQVLLKRWGYSTELHVGVRRQSVERINAHAWLERNGQVLIGGNQHTVSVYSRLEQKEHAPESEVGS